MPLTAKLLLLAEPQGAAALKKLGASFDFYDIDIDDAEQLAAAADAVAALQKLLNEMGQRGPTAITDRVQLLLGRELTAAEREALAASLAPAMAARLSQPSGESAAQSQAQGPWTVTALALQYRTSGHADPWLRAWLDAMAEAASGPHAELADPLLRAALKPTAAGQCGSCHTTQRDAAGRLAIQWTSIESTTDMPSLTHFAHDPHLTQTSLRDCASCHRIAALSTASTASAVATDPHEFTPIERAACAECHQPHAAGDNCTQCHRYHAAVGSGQWAVGSTIP